MKIGYKLILGYLLVASFASFTTYTALRSYQNINEGFERLMNDPELFTKVLRDLRKAGSEITSATKEINVIYNESGSLAQEVHAKALTEQQQLVASGYARYEESLKKLVDLANIPNSFPAEFLEEIEKNGDELVKTSSQIIAMKKKGITGEEILKKREEFKKYEIAYLQTIDAALMNEHKQFTNEQHNVQETISHSRRTTIFVTFLTFILAIISGLYISRLIANRIIKLKEASENVGSGQLETHIEIETKDEIGDLSRSFNKMVEDLKKSRADVAAAKILTDKVLESMVDFVVVTDMDLIIRRVNKAALKLNGYEEHELIGKSSNILSGDRPFSQRGIDILREKGHIANLDKLNLNKDGSLTPISMSFSVFKDDQGNDMGIVCVGKDISARKREEMERQVITEIVQSVITSSNLEELFKIAHQSISKIIYAENCFIALHDATTDLMHFEFWVDKFDPVPPPYPVGKSFSSYILRTGQSILLTEELENQMYERGDVEKTGTDSPSWMGVPLRLGSRTVGVLAVQHYEKRDAYNRRDLELLASVGDQLALAIERKQIEIKLKSNEKQLNDAQRIANLGSWQWDVLMNKVIWSDEFYRIFGFEPQEFEATYEAFLTFMHPDDRKLIEILVENAFKGESFTDFDHRIIRPDGTQRTLLSNGKAIVDETGRLIRMLGTVQDITERKQVEEEMVRLNIQIESQHQRLNDILENIPCVIWEAPLDPNDETVQLGFVNSYITKMHGYSPEEWLSTPNFWSSTIHPDDREEIFRNSAQLFADGHGSNQARWITKDERIIWGETQMVVVKDKIGRPIGLRGVTTDITERKEAEDALRISEEQHRLLFETNPQPAFVYDLETFAFLAVNEAAVRHYGYSREEFLNVITIKDIRPPEDVPVFLEKLSKVTPERDIILAPSRHRKKDGTVVDVEITSHVLDFAGKRAEIVLVNDVTERKRAEEQLKIFNQRLQQSNRELQDFAYVASHDLQEPLRKVQAFADRLSSKYTDVLEGSGLDYLERMRSAAQRMQTLIQDLLSFSRVTTKAQPFVPLDLETVTREVLSDLEVKIEETGATIEVEELPTIDADPLQMRQLIQNLISNALKFYRQDAAPIIKISAAPAVNHSNGNGNGANGHLCQITVKDNGIGFDEKYLDKIFTVFQRLHGRAEYEGSGIGLAVCRKIVERHHGNITARSAPGEGASFIITLPFNQSKVEAD